VPHLATRTLKDILSEVSLHEGYFHAEHLGPDGLIGVNTRGCAGDTPLHVMAWGNDTADAEILLSSGADPNNVGDMGETPLHVAVRKENISLIILLINAGADPNIVSEFGETPADMAVKIGGPVAEALAGGT
jgi:uncharacterized protein